MDDRSGIFAGDDPFGIIRDWLAEAEGVEPNDPNAIALASVDPDGMPDVRMVLLKDIDGSGADGSFVFYTNYDSAKGRQIEASRKVAFVMHWKSLRRQIRVRGHVTREEGPQADAYFASRALQSRIGAWSSRQSQPLSGRGALMAEAARQGLRHGTNPPRPPFWGGYRIRPVQIEFWADGTFRLHDRFVWCKVAENRWQIERVSP
ncbi:MAG: pyridoxamine 5'-phosphate oxidase [Paracoccus sp. (in: a-proteobacteria)]